MERDKQLTRRLALIGAGVFALGLGLVAGSPESGVSASFKGVNLSTPDNPKATPTPQPKFTPTPPAHKPLP